MTKKHAAKGAVRTSDIEDGTIEIDTGRLLALAAYAITLEGEDALDDTDDQDFAILNYPLPWFYMLEPGQRVSTMTDYVRCALLGDLKGDGLSVNVWCDSAAVAVYYQLLQAIDSECEMHEEDDTTDHAVFYRRRLLSAVNGLSHMFDLSENCCDTKAWREAVEHIIDSLLGEEVIDMCNGDTHSMSPYYLASPPSDWAGRWKADYRFLESFSDSVYNRPSS